MGIESVLGWVFAVLIFWGIPIGFIASDPIVSKNERVLWGFATIFVSWFAWLAFLWIAPIFPKENQYLSDDSRRDGANRRI